MSQYSSYDDDESVSGLPMSRGSFEMLIEREDRHYEMIGGLVYAMAEPSIEHKRIAFNVERALLDQLGEKSPCDVIQNYPVAIPGQPTVKPDVVLTCNRADWHKAERAKKHHRIESPLIVVEIISESTGVYDRSEKFERYKLCPSFQVYVVIEQDKRYVEVYRREKNWQQEQYVAGQTIHLDQMDLELDVDDIYARVFRD